MGSVNGRENLRSICMRERMLDARILRFVSPVPIRYLPRTIASKGPVVGNRRYIDPTRWVIPIICPWCLERGNRCTPLSRFFSAAGRLYALFVRPFETQSIHRSAGFLPPARWRGICREADICTRREICASPCVYTSNVIPWNVCSFVHARSLGNGI